MNEKLSSTFLTVLLVFSTLAVGGAGTAVAENAGNTAGNDAGDWTQFGYNAENTGFNPYSTAPTTNLVERWNFTTDSTEARSPVVANGIVYFTDYGDNVYAVNATTGEKVWNYSRKGTVYGTPAVSNGTVYFGWHYFDDNTPDKIFAVNATTGEQIWRFDFDGNPTSPAVVNDTVYFATEMGAMFAVNATTGEKIWNYTTDTEFHENVGVGEEAVYAGGKAGTIYGANVTTGKKEFELVLDAAASVTVWNNSLYYGTKFEQVGAYPLDAGGSSWEISTGADVVTSQAIWNGRVYATTRGGNLLALDVVNGTTYWNRTISDGDFVSTPAVADGVVYVSSNSEVYAVNATSGEMLSNYTVGDHANTPIVANGVVYAGDSNGTVTAVTEYSNLKPPNFQLSKTTNAPVTAGDTLDVVVTVENRGDREATQTVELVVNGTVRDTASVSVAGWESATRTLSWNDTTAGNYTATVRTPNDTASAQVSVEEPSPSGDGDDGSGGGSGGGGSGGNVPPPSVRVEVVEEGDDYRRVKITNARANSPASVSLPGFGTPDATFHGLEITPESDDAEPRFFLNASVGGTPAVRAPKDVETLGYLHVEPTYIDNGALASVTVEFRVAPDAADPAQITLYRYVDGVWKPLSTEFVGKRGGAYVFRADTTGVSLFAVTANDSESLGEGVGAATETTTTRTETTETGRTTTTSGPTDAPTTESSGSVGHGAWSALAPLVALLLALVARARRV